MKTLEILVVALLLVGSRTSEAKSLGAVPPIKGKNLIVISFDGFRADYINEKDTPTLNSFATFDVVGEYL